MKINCICTSKKYGPERPGSPDGPVLPGAPRLPVGPGKPGNPGSYVSLPNAGSPLKPVGVELEQSESYFQKYMAMGIWLIYWNVWNYS